jgi:hypothetical protein
MKTYAEMAVYFEREIAQLGGAPFALSFRAIQQALLQRTLEGDAACLAFFSTRQWPTLSEPVRMEICCRLACAAEWCRACGEDIQEDDAPDFLHSLLIEYWQDVGQWNWFEGEWREPLRKQNWREE